MSLDVGTKCETCLPSPSLETGLNMFVLCYKIKWAKERSNRESRGFVTEGTSREKKTINNNVNRELWHVANNTR